MKILVAMSKLFKYFVFLICLATVCGCKDEVTVTPEYHITSDAESLSFDFEGGEKSVQIVSDAPWQVAASGWLSVKPASERQVCTR